MQQELNNLRNNVIAQSIEVKTLKELEDLRISYLGRNGKLTEIIKQIKDAPNSEKAELGKLVNNTKNLILKTLSETSSRISNEKTFNIDPTTPGTKKETGHLHLITQAIEEIADIFSKIGFTRNRYPEVEWDWFSFGALNFPPNHPARDDWETFWVDQKPSRKYGTMLLTPHTSSGQIREMQKGEIPIRMINIAKCYRRQSDISHTPMFHQFEGLVVDKNISISHLKGTLDYFAKKYFGENREIRLRPHDFVFTEPSFEIDISCDICDGEGCKLCKEGWLELAGAGMVHPNVLKNVGIDPKVYTGFAFGAGVERVLMMKSGLKIDDLRTLYSADYRYLKQF